MDFQHSYTIVNLSRFLLTEQPENSVVLLTVARVMRVVRWARCSELVYVSSRLSSTAVQSTGSANGRLTLSSPSPCASSPIFQTWTPPTPYLTAWSLYSFIFFEVYRILASPYYSATERRVRAAYGQSALPTGCRAGDVTVALTEWPSVDVFVRFVKQKSFLTFYSYS